MTEDARGKERNRPRIQGRTMGLCETIFLLTPCSWISASKSPKSIERTMTNRNGLIGHSCRIPVAAEPTRDSLPASDKKNRGALYIDMMAVTRGSGIPILCQDSLRAS